jgi:hypothetical protein
MLRELFAVAALLVVSTGASAQAFVKYEIQEAESGVFGNQTEFHAKVLDRGNNMLWFCVASPDAGGTLTVQCRDSLATNIPNLKRLVSAASIVPGSGSKSADPIHWWLLDPETGAITFCLERLACQPARYAR